jgi:hypothetical protein
MTNARGESNPHVHSKAVEYVLGLLAARKFEVDSSYGHKANEPIPVKGRNCEQFARMVYIEVRGSSIQFSKGFAAGRESPHLDDDDTEADAYALVGLAHPMIPQAVFLTTDEAAECYVPHDERPWFNTSEVRPDPDTVEKIERVGRKA